MNVVTNNKWIGQRTIRPDGVDKVTGRAAFAADTNMPGMIWGKALRSPHPHARIKSIDTSKAEALAGVKAVVTARDIVDFPIDKSVMLGIQDMRWMCRNVMAREKALFAWPPVGGRGRLPPKRSWLKALHLIEIHHQVLPWVDRDLRRDQAGCADPARSTKFEGSRSSPGRGGQEGRHRQRLRRGRNRSTIFTDASGDQGYEPCCRSASRSTARRIIWSSSRCASLDGARDDRDPSAHSAERHWCDCAERRWFGVVHHR